MFIKRMKIAIVQSGNSGFFPRFYTSLKSSAEKSEDDLRLFCPNIGVNRRLQLVDQITFGSKYNWFVHYHLYKLFGIQDVFSFFDTLDLIKKLKRFAPEVIHFHVVNAWIINFPLLISYVNKNNIKVIWTMHDCRAFTGRCAYFDEINCDRWRNGCGKCPQKQLYWPTLIDSSALQWKLRKSMFGKFRNLHIVTPSKWLAYYVKESFFNKFPVDVIYNGQDLEKFNLTNVSTKRIDAIPSDKKIVLGVASHWEYRKGLEYFKKIAFELSEDYQIILVGDMNKDDAACLPSQVLFMGKTSSFEEMVSLYQRASVFVNPTLADNFPTTNVEALASGTPVVTFDTGGSAEAVDEDSGIVVPQGDCDALKKAIVYVSSHRDDIFTRENCIKRSQNFSLKQFDKYIDLYHLI